MCNHNKPTVILSRSLLVFIAVVFALSWLLLSGCENAFAAGTADQRTAPFAPAVQATPVTAQTNAPVSSDNPAQPPVDNHAGADHTLLSLDDINKSIAKYGSMTIAGMKPEDYDAAQSIKWTALNTTGEPEKLSINLSNIMDYSSYEKYILNLDKYEGVEVDIIGKSGQGRNMYMVKIALGGEKNKPVIMLTGSVHAREFAGAEYSVKFLNDTLKKAQTSASVKALLKKVVIVAVPLVNPDGRELIIDGGSKRRKSDSYGVDLNRAMPSVNAGQHAASVKMIKNFSDKPGLDFFAGYNLGTQSETKAMIKWYDYYVPKSVLYIDLHQQGGSLRYNKLFVSSASDARSKAFAKKVNVLLNNGYRPISEAKGYGLNGDGGTLTDYARSLAEGFTYSYAYGRMVLKAGVIEKPLVMFGDIDNCLNYYKPLSSKFRVVTVEIGRTPGYLGSSERASIRRKREYIKYGWDNFLTGLAKEVLALKD